MNLKLLECVVKAMIKSYNDTSDKHARPLTYEEVINDPRHGIVKAAEAAIREVIDFYHLGL